MHKQFPPEFSALMAQYRDTSAGLGDDHPLARRLWLLVVTDLDTLKAERDIPELVEVIGPSSRARSAGVGRPGARLRRRPVLARAERSFPPLVEK